MASPKTVRVAAVPGIFAIIPGLAATHGAQVEYVGRRVDHDAIKANSRPRDEGTAKISVLEDVEACYPADSDHNAEYSRDGHGVAVFNSLRRMIRDGDIAPADSATASWAGVQAPAARNATPPARVPRRTTSAEGE